MKFGENLKLIRKSKKISQEDLADKLGISRQSVSKWETGENYPSMFNILCLCDIFKCQINELVHDDFVDINSLDDEIKMNVVKFKENEQRKMKGLSKLIYIVARIFKVISIIGIVFSIIMFVASFIVVPNTKFDTKNKVVEVFDHKYTYNYDKDRINILDNKKEMISFGVTNSTKIEIEKFTLYSNNSKLLFMIVLSVSLMLACICLFKMLEYLEKLFVGIHDNDTPFSSDNVNYIKKIALFLALHIFIPDFFGTLSSIIFKLDLAVEIDLINYLFAIIVFVIAYIFKYGYEIQLDSKGRMYGINE